MALRQAWRLVVGKYVYAVDCVPGRRLSHSKASNRRSPYVVLGLRTSAGKEEIKNSFRKLAKKFHPDLNPTSHDTEDKMTELIQAYDELMDEDFGGRVGDSRVALACEMYTINELRIDRLHNVYTIQIKYDDDEQNHTLSSEKSTELTSIPRIEVFAHPDDSVSDLKRRLQLRFGVKWGLKGRRLDRDKIATGWELVTDTDETVLSYHLFLHSYGIKNNDLIHAVVRKYDEVEREAAAFSRT